MMVGTNFFAELFHVHARIFANTYKGQIHHSQKMWRWKLQIIYL